MAATLINTGNVQDIKSTMKCMGDNAFTIPYLWEQVKKERDTNNRTSVKQLLYATIRRKWKKLSGKELFANYPKQDDDRKLYVRYPVVKDNGKWVAVNVKLPSGYSHLFSAVEFDDEHTCANACDIENKLVGFFNAQVLEIINESMKNTGTNNTSLSFGEGRGEA